MDEKYWKISLEEEYKRNKELSPTDVLLIQEWMNKQGHLPKLTGQEIVLFLRACNFSLEKTKDTIDLNYTMRTRIPELFSDRGLDNHWIKVAMQKMWCTVLKERDENGNIVVIYQLQEMDIKEWKMEEYSKLMFMALDVSNLEFGSAPGYVFIHDIQNLTFAMLLHCPISSVANVLKFVQEATVCALKGIHFVNGGNIIEKLFALINPFLNDNVKKMVNIHTNYESLRKAINIKGLPADFGGSERTMRELHEDTLALLRAYRDWFDIESSKRIDEKKRLSNTPKEYGIQGSFRTINID